MEFSYFFSFAPSIPSTSTITFTQEHWTADIGAGGPGFLSFEAFHSFCGFQSLGFTEHDICISRVYSNEAVPGGIRSIDSTNGGVQSFCAFKKEMSRALFRKKWLNSRNIIIPTPWLASIIWLFPSLSAEMFIHYLVLIL